MGKRKSDEIRRNAWGNHILNAVVISVLVIITGYLLKVWEIPLFWALGFLAIPFAILFDRIPKRYRWLKVTIILILPIIIITYAKAGISQYLLVDLGIFLVALELIDYFKNKLKIQSANGYWH